MLAREETPVEFLEAIAKEKIKKEEKRKKEKKKKEKKVKPIPMEFLPPIYRRALPPLPPSPKLPVAWPLPAPPKPPARPPEAEAAAPPMTPVPTPFPPPPPPIQPAPKPVVIRPVPVPPAPAVPAPPALKIELGKLNPLIADETITTIQCDGANLPLKIVKERRLEEISLVLSEEEIKNIIREFSEASGQAITEPFFKVTVGNLTLSAQISAFAGSKFIITKT